jgi:hypothetical protein
MAGEFNKIKVKAIAKIEKYAPGTPEEDIISGKAVPEVMETSQDILVDPTMETLRELELMGLQIPPEAWEMAKANEEKEG